MKELDPGHRYALANLRGSGVTVLQFFKDAALHDGDGADGPSTQEVLRACIARVKSLNSERPWDGNAAIVDHLRMAIALFEARALLRKTEKGLPIECLPTAADGHIRFVEAPQP